jgi:hypothetical protein
MADSPKRKPSLGISGFYPELSHGGRGMLGRETRFLIIAIVGSCLLAATSGCKFHRSSRGFVLRGQWALECERMPPKFSCQPNCSELSSDRQVERASVQPETLPWRSRLRGYHLASRIFHGRDQDAEEASRLRPKDEVLERPENTLLKPEIKQPGLVLD